MLAAAAGVTLLLGIGVASGVVPQASPNVSVASEEAAVTADTVAPVLDVPADPQPQDVVAPTTTTPPVTSAPVPQVPVAAVEEVVEEEPAVEVPVERPSSPPAPVAPSLPARLNPSSAQVMAAIQQLSPSPALTPTEAQAREFGNQVCTAFDQGQTFAQVQQGVLSALSQVPLLGLSVTPAKVNDAIRGAVQLFCPGHAGKLV